MSEDNLDMDLDAFVGAAAKNIMGEMLQDDDLDEKLKNIDFLASKSEKKDELIDDIMINLAGAEEYEHALICSIKYGRLDSIAGKEIISVFAANDPGEAYIYGKINSIDTLSNEALEKLKKSKTEYILETYEDCCKQDINLEDFADTLHEQMIDSAYFGEFCQLVMEYDEQHFAYWIAHDLLEHQERFSDFDEWAVNTLHFAAIAGSEEVAAVVEESLGEISEADEGAKALEELVQKVKFLGHQVESHYDINIPHLKNIRFKKPTGSYGQISYHGMMLKQAVGE